MFLKRISRASIETVTRAVRTVLRSCAWLPTLKTNTGYRHPSDDNRDVTLTVHFTDDGDAWVRIDGPQREPFRIRTGLGGGQSPRVLMALRVLAEAIRQEQEENHA